MPNGPTTYPTLATSLRNAASVLDRTFYAGTFDKLHEFADSVDAMAAELARTRRELADVDVLAQARLRVCDSQARRIREITEQRDNANRRYLATQAESDALRAQLTDVSAAFNRQAEDLDKLIAYADAQPCACPTHELRMFADAEPCDRCKALGRRNDEPVDQ